GRGAVAEAGGRGGRGLVLRWETLRDALPDGCLHFLEHAQSRPSFLMGELSETGWKRYFLVTFALKTPIPLLVLGGAALALALRARGPDRRVHLFLWLPFFMYFGLALSRSINIGHRHL